MRAVDWGGPNRLRYIVEPKSRGFDVVDTTATPRADGFWCHCVDRERAQVIADKLNEAPARAKTGSILEVALTPPGVPIDKSS